MLDLTGLSFHLRDNPVHHLLRSSAMLKRTVQSQRGAVDRAADSLGHRLRELHAADPNGDFAEVHVRCSPDDKLSPCGAPLPPGRWAWNEIECNRSNFEYAVRRCF